MPNTPTIASTSASAAKAITITARKRCRPVAAHAMSSSVTTSLTLTSCSLSIREIAAAHRRRERLGAAGLRPHHQNMSSTRSCAIGT